MREWRRALFGNYLVIRRSAKGFSVHICEAKAELKV